MNIAYFDCQTGLTGELLLEALIDAGADRTSIEGAFQRYTGLEVTFEMGAGGLMISCASSLSALSLPALITMSEKQTGSFPVSAIWTRLFEAAATTRSVDMDCLTINDIGGIDTLASVFGVCEALSYLKIDQIYSTAIPLPATLETVTPVVTHLVTNYPVKYTDHTLPVSPVGVVLLTILADHFTPPPVITLMATGCGRTPEGSALIRVALGNLPDQDTEESITVIETNIDDMNPQFYGHVMDMLFEQGALDAYITPIIMKKGRPGNVLSVLVEATRLNDITSILFRETTTIGLRMYPVHRRVLQRRVLEVETVFGALSIKVVRHGKAVRFTPEYDDCTTAAHLHGVSLTEVYRAVHAAADRLDLDGLL